MLAFFTHRKEPAMRITALLLASSLILPGATLAADSNNPQQNKMAQCNQDASGKSGDERKQFMSQCLSNKPAAETQQQKMGRCNKDANGKKGDERKQFMSDCLKK